MIQEIIAYGLVALVVVIALHRLIRVLFKGKNSKPDGCEDKSCTGCQLKDECNSFKADV